MTTIDKLEGRELDAAVHRARGFDVVSENDGERLTFLDGGFWHTVPHYDIATAIDELDSEWWRWIFMNPPGCAVVIASYFGYRSFASAELADFPTKSAAYATAYCRAWLRLKAMTAKSNEETEA